MVDMDGRRSRRIDIASKVSSVSQKFSKKSSNVMGEAGFKLNTKKFPVKKVAGIACAAVALLATVIVAVNIGNGEGWWGGSSKIGSLNVTMGDFGPKDEVLTKKLLDEVVDITIGEYAEEETENGVFRGINVSITNKSGNKTPLGVTFVAKDKSGKIVGGTTIYLEEINPEETHSFLILTDSELSPEELKAAKVEIYNIYTDTPPAEPESQEAEQPQESEGEQAPAAAEPSVEESSTEEPVEASEAPESQPEENAESTESGEVEE